MTRRLIRPGETDLDRRAFLGRAGLGVGALALPSFLAACGDDEDGGGGGSASSGSGSSTTAANPDLEALLDNVKSKQIVIAGYGGTTQDARSEIFIKPFAERVGVRPIEPMVEGSLGDDMILGTTDAKWDMSHSSNWFVLYALKNGKKPLPKLDPAIPREDLTPPDEAEYSVQTFVTAYVAAHLPGTFEGDGPKSWADVYDTKKFPGKRIVPGPGFNEGVAEPALLADGVAPDELYPLDLERAQAKIASIWDDLVFYTEYPQMQTLLTSKSGAIAIGPNGLLQGLVNKGVDVTIAWDAVPILAPNCFIINPDAPNLDAAQAYAGWVTDPKRIAEFCKATNYGPGFEAAFDEMDDETKNNLPNAPGRETASYDSAYFVDNYDKLIAFNKKLFKDKGNPT
jgi:putative spermidine/putrescine transport system substrate-binding protein